LNWKTLLRRKIIKLKSKFIYVKFSLENDITTININLKNRKSGLEGEEENEEKNKNASSELGFEDENRDLDFTNDTNLNKIIVKYFIK